MTNGRWNCVGHALTLFLCPPFQIRCAALNGYPAARISWEEPKGADIDFSAQPQSHNGQDHTRSEYHTITYKADLKDDGREITCVATQVDRDGRTILFEASTRYVHHVSSAPIQSMYITMF